MRLIPTTLIAALALAALAPAGAASATAQRPPVVGLRAVTATGSETFVAGIAGQMRYFAAPLRTLQLSATADGGKPSSGLRCTITAVVTAPVPHRSAASNACPRGRWMSLAVELPAADAAADVAVSFTASGPGVGSRTVTGTLAPAGTAVLPTVVSRVATVAATAVGPTSVSRAVVNGMSTVRLTGGALERLDVTVTPWGATGLQDHCELAVGPGAVRVSPSGTWPCLAGQAHAVSVFLPAQDAGRVLTVIARITGPGVNGQVAEHLATVR